jgi:hypothetical protein
LLQAGVSASTAGAAVSAERSAARSLRRDGKRFRRKIKADDGIHSSSEACATVSLKRSHLGAR